MRRPLHQGRSIQQPPAKPAPFAAPAPFGDGRLAGAAATLGLGDASGVLREFGVTESAFAGLDAVSFAAGFWFVPVGVEPDLDETPLDATGALLFVPPSPK
jgi:hypothetical protein